MVRKHVSLFITASLVCALAPFSAHGQAVNGKVTTSAPTYANGATAPLSLDTSGGLRLSGSFSATTAATAEAANPSYAPGTQPLSQTLSGGLRTSLITPIPAGTNNIGDVDVLSLPSIPAGANTIGNVNVNGTVPVSGPLTDTQLRATPVPISGSVTASGTVAVSSLPSIPAGTNNIGNVDVLSLPSIPAGSNNIGTVGAASVSQSATSATVTTVSVVKASAGVVYAVQIGATSSVVTWYDNASACSGTARIILGGNTTTATTMPFANPVTFANGISVCSTASNFVATMYQ